MRNSLVALQQTTALQDDARVAWTSNFTSCVSCGLSKAWMSAFAAALGSTVRVICLGVASVGVVGAVGFPFCSEVATLAVVVLVATPASFCKAGLTAIALPFPACN